MPSRSRDGHVFHHLFGIWLKLLSAPCHNYPKSFAPPPLFSMVTLPPSPLFFCRGKIKLELPLLLLCSIPTPATTTNSVAHPPVMNGALDGESPCRLSILRNWNVHCRFFINVPVDLRECKVACRI